MDSLRSLKKKEQQERSALFYKRFALSLFYSQKISESLEKSMREFPTLLYSVQLTENLFSHMSKKEQRSLARQYASGDMTFKVYV